jgi:hypothetical protein
VDRLEGPAARGLPDARGVRLGKVFVGTRGSTFSEAIVEERTRRGEPLGSNYLVP